MRNRPVTDFPRNEAGLVDKFLGTAYDIVKGVYVALPEIRELYEIVQEIPGLAIIAVEAAMVPARIEINGLIDQAEAQVVLAHEWADASAASAEAAAQSAVDAQKANMFYPFTFNSVQTQYDVKVISGDSEATTVNMALWVEGAIEFDFTVIDGSKFQLNNATAYANGAKMGVLINGRFSSLVDNFDQLADSFQGQFTISQNVREEEFQEFLDASGLEVPVPYASGINISRRTQVVTYLGDDYRVDNAFLPLVTTNWLADSAKMKLIGNDTLRAELANRKVVYGADHGVIANDVFDSTAALAAAIAALGAGGGVVRLENGIVRATEIILPRGVVIEGTGPTSTRLKQFPGANRDFITTENFAALTGTGLAVASDARVPYWFGLRNLTVDGNRSGNISGRGVCFYGAYPILDKVVIGWAAGDGLFTEYATNVGSLTSVNDQEEGYARDLVCRDNGGMGWLNRGTHNLHMSNIIVMRNESWGYRSEIVDGLYNGAHTYCDIIHGYLNDFSWTAALGTKRKNLYFGTNGSFGQVTVDGGSLDIATSSIVISNLNQYFGGQGGDMVTISGSRNMIGIWRGLARGKDSTATIDAWIGKVTGDFNSCGVLQFYDNNVGADTFANGLYISGVGNGFPDVFIRGCKIGLKVLSSRNRIKGWVQNSTVSGFQYTTPVDTHGGRNSIDLAISPTSGTYVSGDSPVVGSDWFELRGNGVGAASGTSTFLETTTPAGDLATTGLKTLVVTHGLMYAPRRRDITLNLAGMLSTAVDIAWYRVSAQDATTFTIQYSVAVAGNSAATVSFCSKIQIS